MFCLPPLRRPALYRAFRLLPLLLLIGFVRSSAYAATADETDRTVVRMGIVAYTHNGRFTTYIDHEDAMQAQLPKLLAAALPDIRFETRWYRQNDLAKAVAAGNIDVFLGSSGFYWEMRRFGARDLATVVSSVTPNPNHGNAGVIFVRKDRTDLQTIDDLRGTVLAGGYDTMWQAHLLSLAEIAHAGYDADRFFKRIIRNDLPLQDAVEQVRDGRADVGFLRACVLESRYPNWEREFRIIHLQPRDDMRCVRSTDQYPNATLVAMPSLSSELSRRIAGALLTAAPVGEDRYHWSLTTDYNKVDELYRTLRLGPYRYLREWTLERFLHTYWPLFLAFAVLLLSGAAHLWRVEILVKRRTEALEAEMNRRRKAELAAERAENRFNVLQRSSVVCMLSSIFAHELRQPLATMQHFADTIDLVLQKTRPDPQVLKTCKDGILLQIEKMNAIVERVRSYAQKPPNRHTAVPLSSLCAQIAENERIRARRKRNVRLEADVAPNVFVLGDSLEIELAVNNLVRNAVEHSPAENGRILLKLQREGTQAVFSVTNNGERLSAERIKVLSEPFVSGSRNGLGLGLAIVNTIVEAHRGHIDFQPRDAGGLTVTIRLPVAVEESKHE